VAVIDTASLAKISEIAVGTRPDSIIYDAASRRIFTFNSTSKDATAVDPVSGKAVGTVALGGKPEAAVSDGKGTIFVNIEDKSELIAFDADTLTVKQHYPLAPCQEPSGIAADLAHSRVFSGATTRDRGYRHEDRQGCSPDSHRRRRGCQPLRSGHRAGVQLQRRNPAP